MTPVSDVGVGARPPRCAILSCTSVLRYPSAGASSLSELTCTHRRKVGRFNIGDNTEAVSEDPERYRSGDNDEYTIVRSRERRGGQNKETKA